MDCSTPGLPVPHHLPKFAQVHVYELGQSNYTPIKKKKKKEAKLFRKEAQNGNVADTHVDENRAP